MRKEKRPVIGIDETEGIRTIARGYASDGIVTFTEIYSEAYDQSQRAYFDALERELYK